MRIATSLLIIGVALIAYAISLPPYKDEELFMERYMNMTVGQSKEYWKLRDEMLTPKYKLQDYGGTLVAIGAGLLFITRTGRVRIRVPKTRVTLIVLAFIAPFLSVGAFVFELFLGAARDEYPHWADSLGIPLMSVPVQLVFLLLWAVAHLGFLRSTYAPEIPLALALSRKSNLWLLLVSSITAVLGALFVAEGAYWYAIPSTIWLYFYLSLAAVRRSANDTQQGAPGNVGTRRA
jgi:hypothetical protein